VGMMGREISVPMLELGPVSSAHAACSLVTSLTELPTYLPVWGNKYIF
jgi:hypothetical protein